MDSERTVYEVRYGYRNPRQGWYTGSPVGVVDTYDGPESFRALAYGLAWSLGQQARDLDGFGVEISGNNLPTRYIFFRVKTQGNIGKDMKKRGVKESMDHFVARFLAQPVEAKPEVSQPEPQEQPNTVL